MSNRLSVKTNYLSPIFKELATQYRRRLFCQLFAWGCVGAQTFALLFLWGVKSLHLPLNYSLLWCSLIAPLAACLGFFLSPVPWPRLLQEADRNLGLREKLITFAQYYHYDPENPFLPFLESGLTAELGVLSTKRVFPLQKKPFLLMAGSAFGLFILTLLPGRPALLSPPGAPPPAAPAVVAETPSQPESCAEISPEPSQPTTEALSPTEPYDTLPGSAPLDRPDLRSRLESAPERSLTQAESQGKLEAMDAPPPEGTAGAPARQGQKELEQQEVTAEEAAEAAMDSNRPETANAPPPPSVGPETGEESGSQSGGAALQESIPDEDNFSPPGAGRHSTTHPSEALGVFEPVLEYNPLSTISQVTKESFLSSYLEELYPPVPGLPPGEAQFRERLRRHRAQVLAADGSEELPVVYRELIREYFFLLATEE
ncbi:MAG: hypothetical protein GX050_00970 [Firmicutes bacterium]|nr:hypothetical protein [Bacillota bacterium]